MAKSGETSLGGVGSRGSSEGSACCSGLTARLAVLLALAGIPACGGDDSAGGQRSGGSCVTDDVCMEVTRPADYDVATECGFLSGTWSQSACPTAGYVRKCTQETHVSTNGGPEETAVYVYFWPEGSPYSCLGTEERLP